MNARLPLALLLLLQSASAAPPGLPSTGYPLHALTHARVYVTPERVLEDATLVLRDGKVATITEKGAVPPGARVWDCSGKVIHAGYVEPYLGEDELRGKDDKEKADKNGAGDTVDEPRAAGGKADDSPDPDAALQADKVLPSHLDIPESRRQELLRQGILTVQVVPQHGVFRGHASIYALSADGAVPLKLNTAHVVGLRTPGGIRKQEDYPGSLMGNLAVLRQTFREMQWSATPAALEPGVPAEPSWQALREELPIFFEGRRLDDAVCLHRVLASCTPAPLTWVLPPDASLEPRWLSGRLVCPVDFPDIQRAEARRADVSYAEAAAWRAAPGLPARLARASRPFVLSLHRLKDWKDYREHLLQVRAEGLSQNALLDALTRRPAQWLGLSDRLGTLEPGKWAHLVVRTEDGPVEQVWLQGVPQRLPRSNKPEVTGVERRPGPAYEPEPAWPGPGSVCLRNATVWTQGPAGRLPHADLLIVRGKIRAIGQGVTCPPGVPEVDASGKHVLPGLIDAHSHTAVVGSVNEGTLAVSANVRIVDVLRPRDPALMHQLAGGVTCAHILHGSANAIGGQTVTCKWRPGADPATLVMEGAPPGIKFALGENPKQANWGDNYTTRYPQTRMGVAALIRQRFQEAKRYRLLPHPRPDLALEALGEVLDGRRLVHCHCYRQDEILMLLRVAEEMGFRIATLQHGLEAYKVADEIARHGAGVSTFSDWWAYKLEVIDAIPYNGALLARKGVVVSFNSDSDELARRLLQEAAKAVRYGGLDEQEALNFVTLNPARQLGIQTRVGSLEVGKEGDCSLWSGSPFDADTHCLSTWVDGTRAYEEASYRQQMEQKRKRRAEWLRLAQ